MPTLRQFRPLLPAVLMIMFAAGSQAAVPLVKAHRPVATIVIDASASPQVRAAAKTLQDYIRKSTGATLPVSEDEAEGPSINLGETSRSRSVQLDSKELDQDGFIIRTLEGQHIVIVGGSDWGTEFGTYEFLERYLGVRWLMPTDLGTDIPQRASLSVDVKDLRQEPVYLSRRLGPLPIDRSGALPQWGRFNRARGRVAFHHNMNSLFAPSRFRDPHPDFFPLINGKRYLPSDDQDTHWQPNFSAPDIVAVAVQNIDRYFQRNPDADSYSLGMNDSSAWDESEASQARRSGKKNYLGLEDVSDDYFRWANAVAEGVLAKHPGKLFGLLAYNGNAEPPTQVHLNASIVPFITYDRMRWADPELGAANRALTERWEAMAPTLGFYDYPYGSSYLLPRVYFHQMQQYLAWGAEHHARHYYGELYPNWGEGPKAWVLTKLLWNPHQDTDALLDDWYQHFAGKKAAPKLKAFYALWEDFWTRRIFTSRWYSRKGQYLPFNTAPIYLLDITVADLDRADALFSAARQLAATPAQKARMEALGKMWVFYKASIVAYQVRHDAFPNAAATPAEAARAVQRYQPQAAADLRRQLLQEFASDPLHGPSATNILRFTATAGQDWGSTPRQPRPKKR